MAIDIEKYQKLKQRAEKAKADANRAEGVLGEQKKKLKADFGVETVEEAEKLLETLEKETKEAEQKYNEEMSAFEEKWGKLL